MQIVTHVLTEFPCHPGFAHVQPGGVSGIGLTTGATYVVVGTTTSHLPCTSPDPQPLFSQFIIFHTSNPNPSNPPNPAMPIMFDVQLHFDSVGHLVSAEVAVL
jgi:hypothetical protein